MRLNDTILSQMNTGESARIVDIGEGTGSGRNFNLRGISEGHIVRVISTSGPVTIEVDRKVVSIGRRITQKIRVHRV